MILLISLLIFLPKTLVGFGLAHLLWKDRDLPALFLKFAIGLPLGLAISASLFFVAIWAGIPPSAMSWLEFWAALLLAAFIVLDTILRKKESIRVSRFSGQDISGAAIVLTGAVLAIGAFLMYARAHPYGLEDAWSIWNLPARFIFRENSGAILFTPQASSRLHPDYPIELSLNVAWGWFILQSENYRVPIAISLMATFTPVIIAWSTLYKWKNSLAGALAALVVVLIPDFSSAVGQYADPLLALHMLAATALFYGYLKSQGDGLLILAGLLAGFSAWVKNEGILFVFIFSTICLLATWKTNPWRTVKLLAAGLMLPVLVLILFKYVVVAQNDLFAGNDSLLSQIFDPSRWIFIARNFILHIAGYANWPVSIVIVLSIYAFLMGFDKTETPHHIWLLLICAGQLSGYFLIYLITPHDLELHIDTSMQRLVFHVFPMLILWLFAALRSPNLLGISRQEA